MLGRAELIVGRSRSEGRDVPEPSHYVMLTAAVTFSANLPGNEDTDTAFVPDTRAHGPAAACEWSDPLGTVLGRRAAKVRGGGGASHAGSP